MNVLLLSSLPIDSGCYLRTKYLYLALKDAGVNPIFIKPIKSKPFFLEIPILFLKYLFWGFIKKYEIGIGIKPYPNVTIPLLLKKMFTNIKIGVDIDDIDYGYRKGIFSVILKYLQLPFPKYFDFITYHNENLKEYIIKIFKINSEKLYKLDQGVNLSIFNKNNRFPKEFEKEFKKKHKIKKGKFLIYTAHLNIASELASIFYIIKILSKKIDDIKLIVAGGGPMENYFKSLANKLSLSNNIIFTGYIKETDIPKYVNMADLAIVYYSETEVNKYRVSMKIREYLALGKKVVCNDFSDLKKFKNFSYQTDSNFQNFALKIIDVLKKSDDRGKNGIKFIKENYDWNKIGISFAKFLNSKYENICNHSS